MKNNFQSKYFEQDFKGSILLFGGTFSKPSLAELMKATKNTKELAKQVAEKQLKQGHNVYVPVILDAGEWANARLASALVREIEAQRQEKSVRHCHLQENGITTGIWILFQSSKKELH